MECPFCGGDSHVLDSRGGAREVRRRRACLGCGRRFTTYERLAAPELRVLKREGATEAFDRDKLLRVVLRVIRGRGIAEKSADNLVRGLEAELSDLGSHTVASGDLADRLLGRLRALDAVAASRFAANYLASDGTIRTAHAGPSPQLALPLLSEGPLDAADADAADDVADTAADADAVPGTDAPGSRAPSPKRRARS